MIYEEELEKLNNELGTQYELVASYNESEKVKFYANMTLKEFVF